LLVLVAISRVTLDTPLRPWLVVDGMDAGRIAVIVKVLPQAFAKVLVVINKRTPALILDTATPMEEAAMVDMPQKQLAMACLFQALLRFLATQVEMTLAAWEVRVLMLVLSLEEAAPVWVLSRRAMLAVRIWGSTLGVQVETFLRTVRESTDAVVAKRFRYKDQRGLLLSATPNEI
jgi:hypothetical protein